MQRLYPSVPNLIHLLHGLTKKYNHIGPSVIQIGNLELVRYTMGVWRNRREPTYKTCKQNSKWPNKITECLLRGLIWCVVTQQSFRYLFGRLLFHLHLKLAYNILSSGATDASDYRSEDSMFISWKARFPFSPFPFHLIHILKKTLK